jgi:hypothetical protein
MIIGLAGAKRAGKNETARIIAEEFGDQYEVKEWSFAAKLKQSAVAALGMDADDPIKMADQLKESGSIVILTHDEHIGYEISGREYLQWYGTEAHRDIFGDSFWIDQLLDEIPWRMKLNTGSLDKYYERLDLITDCRFSNEAQAIKESDGYIVRVRRPEVEGTGDTHASETPLPDELIDAEIWNDGSLKDLRWLVGAEIGELLK